MDNKMMGFNISHGWSVSSEEILTTAFVSNLLKAEPSDGINGGHYALLDCDSVHKDVSSSLIVKVMETTPTANKDEHKLYVHRKTMIMYSGISGEDNTHEILNLIHFLQLPESEFEKALQLGNILMPMILPTPFKHGNIVVLEEVAGKYTTGRRIEFDLTGHHDIMNGNITLLHLANPSEIKTQETEINFKNYLGVR